MKRSFLFSLVVAVAGLDIVATARADIGATEYVGHGITPVDAPGIRMVSAKVDIQWGEPGTLSAVFVMNNEEAKATDVQLGFPVSLPSMFHNKGGLDFTMAFDGVPIDRASVRRDTPARDSAGLPPDTIWFHCRHRFPPGATMVKVETKLPATGAYHAPYRQELNYCVQTGAGWKGNIGSEEIAIHFPRALLPGDIVHCEPASGVVDGNTVRWRFENFEPKKGDHDISPRFLEPDVLPILADLRRQSAEAPGDIRKKFNLIKHLFALDFTRYSFPYPPYKVPKDEYRELLATLRSDEDRARIRKLFTWRLDGNYWQKDSVPMQDYEEITTMLSAANYVPRMGRSTFLTEGRILLAQFLNEHPHNAEAWDIYLLQSIGFEFEMAGSLQAYPFQLEQIKTALRHCPDDPTIRLWDTASQLELHRPTNENLRSPPSPYDERVFATERQLLDELEKRGILDRKGRFPVRYRSHSDEYYMGDVGT